MIKYKMNYDEKNLGIKTVCSSVIQLIDIMGFMWLKNAKKNRSTVNSVFIHKIPTKKNTIEMFSTNETSMNNFKIIITFLPVETTHPYLITYVNLSNRKEYIFDKRAFMIDTILNKIYEYLFTNYVNTLDTGYDLNNLLNVCEMNSMFKAIEYREK